MKRSASAQWRGDLKTGKGNLSTASGVLSSTPYSFQTRFEEERGTNPEELLAAAHAGCFTMALSAQLAQANLTAESLETTCTISLEKQPDGFAIARAIWNCGRGCRAPPRKRSTRRCRRPRRDARFPSSTRPTSRWIRNWRADAARPGSPAPLRRGGPAPCSPARRPPRRPGALQPGPPDAPVPFVPPRASPERSVIDAPPSFSLHSDRTRRLCAP